MDGWEKAKLGVDQKKSKCSLNEVKHTGKTNAIKEERCSFMYF